MIHTNTRRGFTLIELLVVVLIIGILAAVALPQYQKAVEKARATEAITLLKSVYEAGKTYYLEHGTWPKKFDTLDINISLPGKTAWYQTGAYGQPRSNEDWSIQLLNDGQTNQGVGIVRISGPYQGAGFHMYFFNDKKSIPLDQLICTEVHRTQFAYYTFGKTDGAYCQSLFNGKFLSSKDGNRYYTVF